MVIKGGITLIEERKRPVLLQPLRAKIYCNDSMFCVKAIYDTGNDLKEPLGGESVHLLDGKYKELIGGVYDIKRTPRIIKLSCCTSFSNISIIYF